MNKAGKAKIHSFSSVPTSITYKLFDIFANEKTNVFVSGPKQLGKSMNLLLFIILNGYSNRLLFLLFPRFTIDGIKDSIYMCAL